jgi:hypothetical protein
VLAALEYLLQQKHLQCRQLPDGSMLYSGTANSDPESAEPLH